ncbi:MAG TPA: restriction endonuclease subunit S [Pyrinomonadaceae bacterium]|nr:restriction endonuclease subunit S [Pyrinomonadaceae bacterium]
MILQERPKAFALWWHQIEKWDYLSAWLSKAFRVFHPLMPISDITDIRRVVVPSEQLRVGAVLMVDKVSFGGEVFAGGKLQSKMGQYLALPGDLIVSKIRARQGSVGLVDNELGQVSVTSHYRVLTPKSEITDARYAWLALRSNYCRTEFLVATGGAMKGEISEENLLNVKVPLPPLSIQQAIVARWQQAQEESKASNERVEKLKAEIDVRFLSDLGLPHKPHSALPKVFAVYWKDFLRWGVNYNQQAQSGADITRGKYPIVDLGSILEFVQYGTSEKANSTGEGMPVIRMNNIVDGVLDLSKLKHISLPEKERGKLLLKRGDILFNRTNSKELVGKCAVFTQEGEFVFASYLIRVKAETSKALPEFLAYAINSPLGRQQIDALSRQIIGQANINTEELRSLEIPLPPLDIQREIMRRVEESRAEIAREREAAARKAREAATELEALILGTKQIESPT